MLRVKREAWGLGTGAVWKDVVAGMIGSSFSMAHATIDRIGGGEALSSHTNRHPVWLEICRRTLARYAM